MLKVLIIMMGFAGVLLAFIVPMVMLGFAVVWVVRLLTSLTDRFMPKSAPSQFKAEPWTGNEAFDEWKAERLKDIERMWAEIDQTQSDFLKHTEESKLDEERRLFEQFKSQKSRLDTKRADDKAIAPEDL